MQIENLAFKIQNILGVKMKVHKRIMPRLLDLENIPRINEGGCAIVAHRLHSFLTEKGYKPQIFYIIPEWHDADITRIKNNQLESCYHAVVRVAGRFYHAGGEFDTSEMPKSDGFKYLKVAPDYVFATLYSKSVSWNPTFNRNYTKQIHNILS